MYADTKSSGPPPTGPPELAFCCSLGHLGFIFFSCVILFFFPLLLPSFCQKGALPSPSHTPPFFLFLRVGLGLQLFSLQAFPPPSLDAMITDFLSFPPSLLYGGYVSRTHQKPHPRGRPCDPSHFLLFSTEFDSPKTVGQAIAGPDQVLPSSISCPFLSVLSVVLPLSVDEAALVFFSCGVLLLVLFSVPSSAAPPP